MEASSLNGSGFWRAIAKSQKPICRRTFFSRAIAKIDCDKFDGEGNAQIHRKLLSFAGEIRKTPEIPCREPSEFIRRCLRKESPSLFRKCTARRRLAIRLRLLSSGSATKQSASFPPSGRIIDGCPRARFSVDDYFKKASSDYARLIGWDSYDNCEVN